MKNKINLVVFGGILFIDGFYMVIEWLWEFWWFGIVVCVLCIVLLELIYKVVFCYRSLY